MDIALQLGSALTGGSLLALPLAFAGGLVAGFNPCCLALYPAAAATCCTRRECGRERRVSQALAFVLGLASAMAALGVGVALVGHFVALGSFWRYLLAVVPLVMGMHLLGWMHLPMERLAQVRLPAGGAFSMGFLLSLVIAPCGTPVLAAVLSYAAYEGEIWFGALLLFVYGVGTGVPLLLVGTASSRLAARFDGSGWKLWVDRTAGGLLLLLGFHLIWIA